MQRIEKAQVIGLDNFLATADNQIANKKRNCAKGSDCGQPFFRSYFY